MMRATARPLSFALLLGVTLLLAACAPAKVLYVDQAWVRLSPNDATPSAGYFTVHGGEEDVRLLSVISPEVLRVEMHESIDKNGVMTMQPIKGVDIPAQGKVTFAPGGKHLMRSEEHTSELQSLMRISYAVFCLKKKKSRPT